MNRETTNQWVFWSLQVKMRGEQFRMWPPSAYIPKAFGLFSLSFQGGEQVGSPYSQDTHLKYHCRTLCPPSPRPRMFLGRVLPSVGKAGDFRCGTPFKSRCRRNAFGRSMKKILSERFDQPSMTLNIDPCADAGSSLPPIGYIKSSPKDWSCERFGHRVQLLNCLVTDGHVKSRF